MNDFVLSTSFTLPARQDEPVPTGLHLPPGERVPASAKSALASPTTGPDRAPAVEAARAMNRLAPNDSGIPGLELHQIASLRERQT